MPTLSEQTKMIFVVGNSRSGTTMLGRILGRSDNIFTLHELHFFEQIWQPKLPIVKIDQADAIKYIAKLIAIQRDGYFVRPNIEKYRDEASEVVSSHSSYWTMPKVYAAFVTYEAGRNGKEIPCDQTPHNLYYLYPLLDYFPNANILNIIRDPRAVLCSQKNRWKRRIYNRGKTPLFEQIRTRINYHPITISLLWKVGLQKFDEIRDDSRVLSLKFEDLVKEPEVEIQNLCNFLNINYHEGMMAIPQVGSSSKPDTDEVLGISKDIANQWKNMCLSDTEIWLCQKITNDFMEKLDYERVQISPKIINLLISVIIWILQLGLVFIVNLGRTRNPFKAAIHRFNNFLINPSQRTDEHN